MIDVRYPDPILDVLPSRPFRPLDVVESGVPPKALSALVADGVLHRPFKGVLVPATLTDSLETRAEAARLVLPGGAALCRITAAWLLGIDARPPGMHPAEPPLECAVPRGTTPVRRPGIRCYATDLNDEDVVEIAGLPCVTPARTAIDLARWLMPGMGLGTLDAMTRAGLVDPAELLIQVERWKGDRFVAQARRLIGLTDPRSESMGESWARLRIHDAGFPAPDLQISLVDERGIEVRRLDMGYREQRWALEYDGEEHHSGRAAEAADWRRREEIDRRWGWTVVGVGKSLVLGPSMAIEYAVGEILSMEPLIRRRMW
jgi:hypothetical protein